MEKRSLNSRDTVNYFEEFKKLLFLVFSWFSHAKTRGYSLKKEHKEVERIYKVVLERYKNSCFNGLDASELAGTCAVNAIIEQDLKLDYQIAEPFYDATLKLAENDGVLCSPAHDFSKEIELSELIRLKTALKRLEKIYEEGEGALDQWVNYVVAMFRSILAQLPEDFELPNDGNNLFQIELCSLLNDPADSIEYIFSLIYNEELLFQGLREQLLRNFLIVSGIDYSEFNTTTKDLLWPTQSKLERDELVNSYLLNTELLGIFHHPIQFQLPIQARIEHCHVVGGTGHGKTQLLQTMILDDIRSGHGFCVIDSQGDLISKLSMLKQFEPKGSPKALNNIILVDPTDIDFPVCLNMFALNLKKNERISSFEKERLINATVDLYAYIFGALFGAELTQKQGVIFGYLAKLMMEIPGASIQTLRELLEDGKKYTPYMEKLTGSAYAFYQSQFFSKSFAQTKKQVLTRLWGVLSNSTLERLFSHSENKIDVFKAINSGKSILINTSKDLLGVDGSKILGRFFIALLGQSVLRRVTIPEEKRKPFFIYIDEAHEYFDEKIEGLLNQARKYNVGITLAHQNLSQLNTSLKATLMSSSSIKLVGGVNSTDASQFAHEMHTKPESILRVKKTKKYSEFACWIKNTTSRAVPITVPFGILEREPVLSQKSYAELIESNRDRYCCPIEEIVFDIPSSGMKEEKGEIHSTEKIREAEKQIVTPAVTPQQRKIPKDLEIPKTGRGGPHHRYLQNLIKRVAQEKGFKAVTEQAVFEGAGSIDVALESGNKKIAVEISVSTDAHWEMQNVSKCLSAGYDKLVILATENKQLNKLREAISGSFPHEVKVKRILFLVPDSFISFLDEENAKSAQKTKTVRGYKVKVNYSSVTTQEEKTKKDAIAKVIMESMKRMK